MIRSNPLNRSCRTFSTTSLLSEDGIEDLEIWELRNCEVRGFELGVPDYAVAQNRSGEAATDEACAGEIGVLEGTTREVEIDKHRPHEVALNKRSTRECIQSIEDNLIEAEVLTTTIVPADP